jgi:hypothetical protein
MNSKSLAIGSTLAQLLFVALLLQAADQPERSVKQAAPAAESAASSTPATQSPGRASQIDAHADQVLRRACTMLANSKAFTFHAEISFDQVLPSQVKLQFAAAADYGMQRPNMFAMDYESDLGAKRLWYNGTTLTIFDASNMRYLSTPAPSSIDAMLESLGRVHNLTVPLADLVLTNACDRLGEQILFSKHVGRADVGGAACDHLAFAETNIDWQVWVQRLGNPLIRKLMISYRTSPGLPQYVAVLSDWQFPKIIPATRFRADVDSSLSAPRPRVQERSSSLTRRTATSHRNYDRSRLP